MLGAAGGQFTSEPVVSITLLQAVSERLAADMPPFLLDLLKDRVNVTSLREELTGIGFFRCDFARIASLVRGVPA